MNLSENRRVELSRCCVTRQMYNPSDKDYSAFTLKKKKHRVPVKFHGSGYVGRSDQTSLIQTPSNSQKHHFICTNRNSEEIKRNLSSLVSLRFPYVFNPSRLPKIYLLDRIYNLNIILFHHILWPYAGGFRRLIYIYYSQ